FSHAVQQLLSDGHTTFLELSPHPTLLPALAELVPPSGGTVVLPSLRRDQPGPRVLRESLAALYANGQPIAWDALYPSGTCVQLPTSPWQRERFWLDFTTSAPTRRPRPGGHPLLGEHQTLSVPAGAHLWQTELDLEHLAYLRDHRVEGHVVLPAAAYLDMVLGAAGQLSGSPPARCSDHVEHVQFQHALVLPEQGSVVLQLVLSPAGAGSFSWQIASQTEPGTSDSAWRVHASGTVRLQVAVNELHAAAPQPDLADTPMVRGDELYAALADQGLLYGPAFQGIRQLWRHDGHVLADIRLPEHLSSQADKYRLHPALLDSALQVLGAALPGPSQSNAGVWLPVGLERLQLHLRTASAPRQLRVHAHRRAELETNPNQLIGDLEATDEAGHLVFELRGLRAQRLEGTGPTDELSNWLYEVVWRPQTLPETSHALAPLSGRWLVFGDADAFSHQLCASLTARGASVIQVQPSPVFARPTPDVYQVDPRQPDHFQRLLTELSRTDQPPCRGVVYLWSASTSSDSTDDLETAQTRGCIGVLHLVQALIQVGWRDAPRLWLVTRGAQSVLPGDQLEISQAPLWGLGRTLALEHPELNCTLLDVHTSTSVAALVDELASDGPENQVAWRDTTRFVARMVRATNDPQAPSGTPTLQAGARPFRLEQAQPGRLDGLRWRASQRRLPGPGEVEIEVVAAGLNFLDVLTALGGLSDHSTPARATPSPGLGSECSGRIVALGQHVQDLRVGDAVVAVAPGGTFSRFVTTAAALVVLKPRRLSFAEAATLPVAFLTASYALQDVAQLRQGERVLIHAASGGVGLAAVQLAQRVGAEIYATAGTPEKRDYLRQLGVAHALDSRSLAFADDVRRLTSGQGVDVVLNSLGGEFIDLSLGLLRDHGRFVELGKRDYLQNRSLGLRPFLKNLTFRLVDLRSMAADQAVKLGARLQEVLELVDQGQLEPLPRTVFSARDAGDAFHHLAQARHIGKLVIDLANPEQLPIAPAAHRGPLALRADASYLISGGLGDLGLALARWLVVDHGARHLTLLGRHAPSPAAEASLAQLRAAGADIRVAQVDVAHEHELAAVLRSIVPALRGVFHAAAVLDDGILLRLDQQRFERVLAPKLGGAWNLHRLTRACDLDLFV
ncbi:MAG TPA: polyketide synthase dehydratase domain-containing protein, partial [Chloroflexota bacterium]|nr:polyketide synthase dehydratase domain-containing protein [Chloroflexota bacterium]